MQKANRNDPCPCNSGKKFKKCCELKKAFQNVQVLTSESALLRKTGFLFQKMTTSKEKIEKVL